MAGQKKEFKIIAIASSKQSIYILIFYSRVEETEPQRHKNLSKDALCWEELPKTMSQMVLKPACFPAAAHTFSSETLIQAMGFGKTPVCLSQRLNAFFLKDNDGFGNIVSQEPLKTQPVNHLPKLSFSLRNQLIKTHKSHLIQGTETSTRVVFVARGNAN